MFVDWRVVAGVGELVVLIVVVDDDDATKMSSRSRHHRGWWSMRETTTTSSRRIYEAHSNPPNRDHDGHFLDPSTAQDSDNSVDWYDGDS